MCISLVHPVTMHRRWRRSLPFETRAKEINDDTTALNIHTEIIYQCRYVNNIIIIIIIVIIHSPVPQEWCWFTTQPSRKSRFANDPEICFGPEIKPNTCDPPSRAGGVFLVVLRMHYTRIKRINFSAAIRDIPKYNIYGILYNLVNGIRLVY